MVQETPETNSGIEFAEDEYTLLHQRFAESEYGKLLSGRSRFERYRPDHMSEAEWIELLGPDVDDLEHHIVTYNLAKEFIESCEQKGEGREDTKFDEREVKTLLLAATVNNWGEVELGNISYEHKTAEHLETEINTFRRVFADIYGKNPKIQTLLETTIFDKTGKLGMAFNAIERTGYLKTALYAFEQSERSDDLILGGQLKWLAAGVLSNQIPREIEYSRIYPPVQDFLDQNAEVISRAFSEIPPQIFIQHGQTENQKREMYTNARLAWVGSRSGSEIYDLGGREAFSRGPFGEGSNIESRFIQDYGLLKETIEAFRNYVGVSVVLTSGTFDMIHHGHGAYLEKASEYGSFLLVGVDSDAKVHVRKGPTRPTVPENERIKMLTHIRSVDMITLKPDVEERWQLIKLIRPDTLVVTQEHYRDYTEDEIEELKQYVGRIVALEPQAETSTSARIRRLHTDLAEKLKEKLPGFIDRLIEDA